MRDRGLPAILLLDEFSRNNIGANLSSLSSMGLEIINSLRDISESSLMRSRKVILLDGCLRKPILPDLELFKEMMELNYYFISQDKESIRIMSSLARCHVMDPLHITYEKLYSIINEDTIALSGLQQEYVDSDIVKTATELSANQNMNVRKVADGYLSLKDALYTQNQKIASMEREIEILKINNSIALSENLELRKYHDDLLQSSIDLARSLDQYEVIFSRDIYNKLDLNQYRNRPVILYLKEYEELVYLNSLLATLLKVFRHQERKAVKVLQLFDSHSSKKISTIPEEYIIIPDSYHSSIVSANDRLVKFGGYQELLGSLLTNTAYIDLLVIVDRKQHNDSVLSGKYISLGMCRNGKNIPKYGLDEKTTITNSPGSELSWEYYAEYAKLNEEERLLFLSSRPIIKYIMQLLRSSRR